LLMTMKICSPPGAAGRERERRYPSARRGLRDTHATVTAERGGSGAPTAQSEQGGWLP